jgi:hypothetical protein
MKKAAWWLTATFVLNASGVFAQEFRTVSVFSPVNAQRVVSRIKEIAANNPSIDSASTLNKTFDFNFAKSVADILPTDGNAIPSVVKPPPNVVRRNVVSQNLAQLTAVLASAQEDHTIVPVLSVDLFQNVHLKITTQTIKRLPDGTLSIGGYVQDMPGSVATLTKKGNDLSGTIITYTDLYEIRPSRSTSLSPFADVFPTSAGTTVIDQVKREFKNEAEPSSPANLKKRSSTQFDIDPNAGNDPLKPTVPTSIDVAVFYTPQAETGSGGTAAISSLVVQAIQSVQSSLDAYKVKATVNLVYSGKTNYQESDSIELDRDRLQNPTDGFMDDVPKKRDGVKADLVALIVEGSGDYCGVSYLPEDQNFDYADYAYIVVARSCAVANLSFAHEFGHILGVRHDRYIDPIEGKPLAANHGMIFACGSGACRDIPAYDKFCGDVLKKPCPRILAWSGVYWPGGSQISESANDVNNNAQRALRIFAPIVAKYR